MARRQASREWHRQYRADKRSAGLCQYCKNPVVAHRMVCAEHLEVGRKRAVAYNTARYRDADRRALHMRLSAAVRAKRDGVQCTLTTEWIKQQLDRGTCAVTGLPFDLSKHQKWKTHPYAPSVDRVVAGGDYSPENCRVVLLAVNAAMNEWGEDVFRIVATAYLSRITHGPY